MVENAPGIQLDPCAAPRSAQFKSVMQQDLVAPRVQDLGVVYRERLEGVEDLEVVVPGGLGTARAGFRPIGERHDFEVRIVDREPGGSVPRPKGFRPSPHES